MECKGYVCCVKIKTVTDKMDWQIKANTEAMSSPWLFVFSFLDFPCSQTDCHSSVKAGHLSVNIASFICI